MGGTDPDSTNNFKSQEVVIDGQSYTAQTPAELQQLQQKKQEWINQSTAYAGSPERPEWDSMLRSDGMMQDQYQMSPYVNLHLSDDYGFNKFQTEALRDGLSQASQYALDQRELDKKDQIGDISDQYQMGLQSTMDSLASQGGLMTGAGERMGANSIKDLLQARQGARSDFNKDKLSIMAQDEQDRVAQLQSLAGMEQERNNTYLQGIETDLTNSLKERDAQRTADLDKWNTEMSTWASNKQADAQASAGSGGCFPKGTLVDLANGHKRPIEQIEIGDELAEGGIVTKTIQGSAIGTDWFSYKGVIVTGDHAVFENNKWIRVKDSDLSEPLGCKFQTLYNLSCENHELLIGGLTFSDFDEVDDQSLSDEECLSLKNKGVYA